LAPLGEFSSVSDVYSGYDGLYQSGRVIEIGCWAHARRRFVDAFMIDTSAALWLFAGSFGVPAEPTPVLAHAERITSGRSSSNAYGAVTATASSSTADALRRPG
jgi:transposase IS66 family protein